ncbi:hypothetical protein BJ742DRAFT_770544 [Cladochytrium replicatum]|nr:hypothetical protein BJ742DRAFT_770544 [Cladochytrium replicatum]
MKPLPRRSRRLHAFTLSTLLLGTGVLAFCMMDVFLRTINPSADKKYLLTLAITAGTLFFGAFIATTGRAVYTRRALANIPRFETPVKEKDLPKPVHKMVHSQFAHTASIRREIKPDPKSVKTQGWGRPGDITIRSIVSSLMIPKRLEPGRSSLEYSIYSDIRDFRQAKTRLSWDVHSTSSTYGFSEDRIAQALPHMSRKPTVTARAYLDQLSNMGVLNRDVTLFYLEQYESVRFSNITFSEEQYKTAMKIFTALVKSFSPEALEGYTFEDKQ